MRAKPGFGLATLLVALVSFAALPTRTHAGSMFSVTDLGTADPSGNYLTALSPADQATFQAGSFDMFAHPPTVRDVPEYQIPMSENYQYGAMATSNNQGINAGVMTNQNSFLGEQRMVAIYYPGTQYPLAPVQTNSSGTYGQFYGTVAGFNDHNVLALTEYQFPNNNPWPGVQVPYLQGAGVGGAYSLGLNLGSLGGVNGVANALNNGNQVVGWSQTASGAQHAFLFSNGQMQDLNLLIPPASGIVLDNAVGIDGSGRIVAYGTDSAGNNHELLLTPSAVPEPSTLVIVSVAFASCLARRWPVREKNNDPAED